MRNTAYFEKQEDTPDWATFAVVRFVTDPTAKSIDEVVTYVPSAPTSVTIKLNRDPEYADLDKVEQMLRSIHRTELWMHKEGILDESITDLSEDFDEWTEDVAGFLIVIDKLPEELDEEDEEEDADIIPLEGTGTTQD